MKRKIIVSGILLLQTAVMLSQEVKMANANKKYDGFAYVDAIKTYEKVAEKGYQSEELFQRLGNAYYFQADLANAAKWYTALFEMTNDPAVENYFRYAQSLKAIGNYKKADEMMEAFYKKNAADSRASLFENQKDYLARIKENSGRYTVENAGINSKYSDYGTAFFGDQLVFATSRESEKVFALKHKWTNQAFSNLYFSKVAEDKTLSEPEKIKNDVNSIYNESTPVFTSDGQTMYFTRNNFNNGKKGKDDAKSILLKLYKATLVDGKWSAVTELPFNSDQYSCAHPALSVDEKTLYFASNMPGGVGESDLYKVEIKDNGTFGKPENLGNTINTEARETFPFISKNNELYFASDGHPGLGGLDVFTTLIEGTSFGKVNNVGSPVNSPFDDFAMIIDTKDRKGFFSSNRTEDNLGFDDIYKFSELKPLEKPCEQLLSGVITDVETKLPIAGAKVYLLDSNFNKTLEQTTDAAGRFDFGKVNCQAMYYVRGQEPEYNTAEKKVAIPKETGKTETALELEKKVKPLQVGDDLRTVLNIDIIYFDLDKWNIRPDAAVELAKILETMKEYPNIQVDVRSHTDSRSSHKYNETLSSRRAKSTVDWLVKNGIAANRLTSKGYGESQLLNGCSDGVKCSEEDHQRNRRSEFIIVKM